MKGGDGGLGSYDGGAGGGGGYFGGGGGGEGGGIDGPPGGGGSGFLSELLDESGTVSGQREIASTNAQENGYANNHNTIGRVKVIWESDNGPLELVLLKPGEYQLNPISFQNQ